VRFRRGVLLGNMLTPAQVAESRTRRLSYSRLPTTDEFRAMPPPSSAATPFAKSVLLIEPIDTLSVGKTCPIAVIRCMVQRVHTALAHVCC
jgi:hypothetical protein